MTKMKYVLLFSLDVVLIVFANSDLMTANNNCILQKDNATLTQRLQCSKSEGTKWLLNKRNPDWGWGTRGEAQSIIALHLSNDRLLNKSDPYVYISVKEMNIDLLKALSHDTELASSEWGHGVLGIYVTALIATCQDPHDFYGFDLLDKLQFHVENFTDYYKSNKFAYSWALIGICVAGGQIEDRYKDHLVTQFGNTSFNIDTVSMILMALSCGRSDVNYDTYIQNLASSIASKQLPSGAFGNEYTTALAVQALLSINDSRMTTVVDKALFNLTTTLEQSSYAFRDVLAAAQVLPALSRTSFIDVSCPKNNVLSTSRPNDTVVSIQITVESAVDAIGLYSYTWNTTSPIGRNLFQMIQKMEKEYTDFSFQYQRSTFGVMIDTVNGLYADPKQRMYWSVLEYPNKPLTIGCTFNNKYRGFSQIYKCNGKRCSMCHLLQTKSYITSIVNGQKFNIQLENDIDGSSQDIVNIGIATHLVDRGLNRGNRNKLSKSVSEIVVDRRRTCFTKISYDWISRSVALCQDTVSMILMALSCGRSDVNYDTYIQNLVSSIASKQLPSGAFGNEYTTALAVQALLSINDSRMTTVVDKALFNLTTTLEQSSYAFRDVLAAAQVLPALSRTSFIDVSCPKNNVLSTSRPNDTVVSIQITVESAVDAIGLYSYTWNTTSPIGRNLFQMIQKMEKEYTDFSFQYQRSTFGVMIDTVNGLYADPKQRMYWSVLGYPNKPLTIGISHVIPKNGDHYVLRLTTW